MQLQFSCYLFWASGVGILGALVSIRMIWLLNAILVYEAMARIIHDTVRSFCINMVLWLMLLWLYYWVMIMGIIMAMVGAVMTTMIAVMDMVPEMLQNISEVLEESTPREIDAARLEKDICEMEKMVAIHELHI
ncbi:hypothetical protein V6N11_058050 [Hibiscus sabdariffa]|uniref:Uncharacterized protein n=1 Tax=Hibiscus sabdariffa TaxID=183260 RepID=A0ABR2N811_9ROSI